MRIVIFKRPAWRNIVLWGILLFVLIAYRENATSVFSGKLKPIYSANVKNSAIGLTFDILKKEGLHATFFLSSPWADKHQQLVQRMVMEGHEIGSHGNRHIDLNTLGALEIENEITTSQQVLEQITGRSVRLIRTPNGAYNNKVIATAHKLGYQVIQWSVDSLDWKRPGSSAVINNVLNGIRTGGGAKAGDIILFHASDSAPDTVQALPTVIQRLKGKGYKLVPISQLLSEANSTWPPESNLKEEPIPPAK